MSPYVRNMDQKFTPAPSHRIREGGCNLTPRTEPPDQANNEHNRRGLQGGGDVESDAAFKREGRDAPGQSCLYITPGMHNEEHYRLATFSKYPNDVPAKVADMAAAGFYYSGFKDRVKCYSCGISVENWMAGDDGMDKKWHKSDCRLVAGADAYNKPLPTPIFQTLFREYKELNKFTPIGNNNIAQKNHQAVTTSLPVRSANNAICSEEITTMENVTSNMANFQLSEMNHPPLQLANVTTPEHKSLLLGLNLKKEADRRKSFAKWPSYPVPNLPGELAQHGFFYLGNIDRTQCFSCSGVLRNWAAGDNVQEQHRTHLSECRIVKNLSSGNIPMTDSQRRVANEVDRARITALRSAGTNGEPLNPSIEEQQQLEVQFPCSRPTNPHIESLVAQIASFDSRRPGLVLASKEHLARAGFFFLGQSNKAKCFYCNGGLQNWDPEDEPWTEHAKRYSGGGYSTTGNQDFTSESCTSSTSGLIGTYELRYHDPADQQNNATPFATICSDGSYPMNTDQADTVNLQSHDINYLAPSFDNVLLPEHRSLLMSHNLQRETDRRRSFAKWPSHLPWNLPSQLSRDGFYYLGNSDRIQCFSCGGTLINWPSDECAYGMHRLHLPECRFVDDLNSGNISMTDNERRNAESAENCEMIRRLRAIEAEQLCKICKKNKASVVLLLCSHLCVCEGCSERVKVCPICKANVQSIIQVVSAPLSVM